MKVIGVKSIRILLEIFFFYQFYWSTPSFVKIFGLTSRTFVMGMVTLILMRNDFNYFNFYILKTMDHIVVGQINLSSSSP